MDLIYYKSIHGNFGDDLNKWLWPKILGTEIFQKKDDSCLIGIGSILDNNSDLINKSKNYKQKYIIGTGVRSINTNLDLDSSYKSLFYRGPLSSFKIENTIENYISDGAYVVALTDFYKKIKESATKKYKVGFIPYFRSENIVDWKKICKENSWRYISPSSNDIEFTLNEIVSSECIITEAMHGAIIADVFRVPWKRIRFYAHIHESEAVSEFKWNDWLSSIDCENKGYWELPYIEASVFPKRYLKYYFNKKQYNLVKNRLHESFEIDKNYNLSDDIIFNNIILKLKNVVQKFKENYK